MLPDCGSNRRKIKFRIVLFPEPLSPIIPTKLPGRILKDSFSITDAPGEYKNVTLLNYIYPLTLVNYLFPSMTSAGLFIVSNSSRT